MTTLLRQIFSIKSAHFVSAMAAGSRSAREARGPRRAQQKGVLTIVVICSHHIPTSDTSNQIAHKRVIDLHDTVDSSTIAISDDIGIIGRA